jgi:hypothetical protein
MLSLELIIKNVYTMKISAKNWQKSPYILQNQKKEKEKSATYKTLGLSHNTKFQTYTILKRYDIKP